MSLPYKCVHLSMYVSSLSSSHLRVLRRIISCFSKPSSKRSNVLTLGSLPLQKANRFARHSPTSTA